MKKLAPYYPGIILFLIAVVIGMLVYQDYGIGWDEPAQRDTGVLNYDYVFNGSEKLFQVESDHHGAAFELVLLVAEKWMKITDARDLYLMRHLVSHFFFLVGMLFGYVLIYRLFRSRFIACLGFVMLLMNPRIYVHSFINSKDTPFLAVIIIFFTLCHIAFEKRSMLFFILAGLACGYATGIRVMGIMFAGITLLFLLPDIINAVINKQKPVKPVANAVSFSIAFCLSLYTFWPYLWKTPLHNFAESYAALAHFPWPGSVLFMGKSIVATNLPASYFPVWFLISNPPLWLIAGVCGAVMIIAGFVRRPMDFIKNSHSRNFLFYLFCFLTPVLAVILLHSVIYDDWRHLYFVYPSFVLMALYFINRMINTRYRVVVMLACAVQIGFTGYFMISSHPFQQVYFNSFVSHKPEYLRKNYDMEYWGCSFKDALDHLVATDHSDSIRILGIDYEDPLPNNIMMLQQRDRKRIILVKSGGDYFITTYRNHPENYDYPKVEYTIRELNSTILCVYKIH